MNRSFNPPTVLGDVQPPVTLVIVPARPQYLVEGWAVKV